MADLEAAGLQASPSAFRRHTMACTGIEFCKLAIVETKARAADLIGELERRLPDFDEPVTINVNGCPNSCARIQTADIGLKGSLVPGRTASRWRGSRCIWAAAWPAVTGRLGVRAQGPRAEDHGRSAAGLCRTGPAPVRRRP